MAPLAAVAATAAAAAVDSCGHLNYKLLTTFQTAVGAARRAAVAVRNVRSLPIPDRYPDASPFTRDRTARRPNTAGFIVRSGTNRADLSAVLPRPTSTREV